MEPLVFQVVWKCLFHPERKISMIQTYNTCKDDQKTVFYDKKVISINYNKNTTYNENIILAPKK